MIFLFVLGSSIENGFSQITLDGSLGLSGPLIGPDFSISADLGEQVGENLFHSFSDFNLANGESATFSGPENVENILSRVTGANPSDINGIITSTIQGANFFILNPNGVIFGPNAKLDITGSFTVSTADYIGLANGGRFDATNPEKSSLTSAPITTYGFLDEDPIGEIFVFGEVVPPFEPSILSAAPNESISFVGGDISIVNGSLQIFGGQANLVSAKSAGEIPFETNGKLTSVETKLVNLLGTITLVNSGIFLREENGGRIFLNGKDITLTDGVIFAATEADPVFAGIDLHGRTISISNSVIRSDATGTGKGIDIIIKGENVTIDQTSSIETNSFNRGDSGSIFIDADVLAVSGQETVISTLTIGLVDGGRSGDITIHGHELKFNDGATIASATTGSGDSGNITINSMDSLLLVDDNPGELTSDLFTSTDNPENGGNGGNITIQAVDLEMINFDLSTETQGGGRGGSIQINAETLRLVEPQANISTVTSGINNGGNSGDVLITSNELEVNNGATIFTGTSGSGHAGSITLDSGNRIQFKNSDDFNQLQNLFTRALDSENSGDGGDITILTGKLEIQNAIINTETQGKGNAGNINLAVSDSILLADAGMISTGTTGKSENSGKGGDIVVVTANLDIKAESSVSALTTGPGNSGNINLEVGDLIRLFANGAIFTGTSDMSENAGLGGDIIIGTTNLEMVDEAEITAQTLGQGNSGRISIEAEIISLFRSDLQDDSINFGAIIGSNSDGESNKNIRGGNSGNIEIITNFLNVTAGSVIGTVTRTTGVGGDITIIASEILLDQDLSIVPTGISSQTLAEINGGDSGKLSLTAGKIKILNGAGISTSTFGHGQSGEIRINSESILIDGLGADESGEMQGAFIEAETGSMLENAGNSGNILINAEVLILSGGGAISSSTKGMGHAQDITISAEEIVLHGARAINNEGEELRTNISTGSFLVNNSNSNSGGDAGNIFIQGEKLEIVEGAIINSSTNSTGDAGKIRIDADSVKLDGIGLEEPSQIVAATLGEFDGAGKGGNIIVSTTVLDVTDGATINAGTFGTGDGQGITIKAENIKLAGFAVGEQSGVQKITLIETQSTPLTNNNIAAGDGGNIIIDTISLEMLDSATISTGSTGSGNSGDIQIFGETIFLSGSEAGLFSTRITSGTQAISGGGVGGNIDISANVLELVDGAIISSATSGSGDSGNIHINADTINLSGISKRTQSTIGAVTFSEEKDAGRGGDITVDAGLITVVDGGQIVANTFGAGDAGNIFIVSEEIFAIGSVNEFQGASTIATATQANFVKGGTSGPSQ